jgi:beta-glucosidase
MKTIKLISFIFCLLPVYAAYSQEAPSFFDETKSVDERVNILISQLTLEEKVQQMMHNSPAIPRLGIPAYDWWNEALHGVGRSGNATVFPQAIGLAATFDPDLALRTATAVSDEARAIHNAAIARDNRARYTGLTFWTPNINIFRDPRWGRGQETYGEDPYLTSEMGLKFMQGLQGNNPKYLKVAACAKHFAVHSGPERLRHEFNATVSNKDLFETYLPAFKVLVDGGVEAVMCAYNRTNGEPCCGNGVLLVDILRGKWGFKGHVVSDCWAIQDFHTGHKVTANPLESAVLAFKNGVNLNCGVTYFPNLVTAVEQGLLKEEEINQSLAILLRTRFKLGMFDKLESDPYSAIPPTVINCDKHRKIALESAQKSIVLLKNNGVLPLSKDTKSLFLTGPNATSTDALLGNYYGLNQNMVTIQEGIIGHLSPGSVMQYKQGFLAARENINPVDWISGDAKDADVSIVAMGLTVNLEGEEGESIESAYYGDRLDYNLPENQINFLKKLRKDNKKPIIVIITAGSPVNMTEISELADAVIWAWYPGEEGGNAVADVLFGDVSPSGRLPITFPKSLDQLPPYESYDMQGRTYRYMSQEPFYPFGYGLSYTKFVYSGLKISKPVVGKNESFDVEVAVQNQGKMESDEVVQLYLKRENEKIVTPLFSIKGFKHIHLKAGESSKVSFTITPEMMSMTDGNGDMLLQKGNVKIFAGGSLPTQRSLDLGMSAVQQIEVKITD